MRLLPFASGESHPRERTAGCEACGRIRPSAALIFVRSAAPLLGETGEPGEPANEQPVTTTAIAATGIKRRVEDALRFTNASIFFWETDRCTKRLSDVGRALAEEGRRIIRPRLVKNFDTSCPRSARRAISSADTALFLRGTFMQILFLSSRFGTSKRLGVRLNVEADLVERPLDR